MKQAWQHFLQYKPLLKELVSRDLKVKYRRSFLGYVWSLLNPLLMMCVMTLVFSYMFRFDIPNYPLYLITGQTLWSFFNESTNMSMYSVLQNGALIKKVYIPKFIFPISRVLSSFVTMSFSLAAILIVMVFTKAPFCWTILLFPIPLFFLLLFAMGIGMVLSALSVYFRDITHLYRGVLKPGGFLCYEFGEDQADAVCAILEENGFTVLERKRDFNDRERAVLAQYGRKE